MEKAGKKQIIGDRKLQMAGKKQMSGEEKLQMAKERKTMPGETMLGERKIAGEKELGGRQRKKNAREKKQSDLLKKQCHLLAPKRSTTCLIVSIRSSRSKASKLWLRRNWVR